MIKTTKIFIPIPKTRNTKVKVEIDGDNLTSRVVESDWVKPVTNGIGTFKVKLSNANGILTGTYSTGSIVKFYADNIDASTLQFWGRIDYIKDDTGKDGQFLEIEGRHRSYLLNEYFICYSTTNTPTSTILKAIINKLPSAYGFTYNNVSTTTDTMSVEWDHKSLWDCVVELCNYAGYDCYVDDDLDFHYFEENSIANTSDAVVEGDNLLDSKNWGTNDYYEKTRVTVTGQNKDGLPIVYTAIVDNEGNDIRELFVKDSSANTETKVKNIAEAKLSEYTNRNPQANLKTHGLETINPGDNIWILIPRQEIHGQYKMNQITHKFGMKVGGWRTELVIEEDEGGISKSIEQVNQKSDRSIVVDNVNKFNYSFIYEFNTNSGTHSGTQIIDGVLKLASGETSGTWESDLREVDDQISICEMRSSGDSTSDIVMYISSDGGGVFYSIQSRDIQIISGKKIKIKIDINSESTQIKSIVFLYS